MLWVLNLLLSCAFFAVIYRGKGGGWKTWGVLSKRLHELGFREDHWLMRLSVPYWVASSSATSHGLTALLAALYASAATGMWERLPLFALTFLLATKLDIGTGFAVIHGDASRFHWDINQPRDVKTRWVWLTKLLSAIERGLFWPGDYVADWVMGYSGRVRVAAFVWLLWRGFFFAPYFLLGAGSISGVLWLALFPFAGLLGALLKRRLDGVEVFEWTVGPVLGLTAVKVFL